MNRKISRKIVNIAPLAALIILLAVGCNKKTALIPPLSSTATLAHYTTPFHVGTQTILVDVAATDATREQGLSGRAPLQDNQGMLFDMRGTTTARPGFWMKDMLFDLDFIWIDHGTVIGVTTNVPAPRSAAEDQANRLQAYYPPADVDTVLEVNASWTMKHTIKIGDTAN